MAKPLVADFSKVDDSKGGRVRVAEGDYKFKVKEIKEDTSKAGNTMLVWTFEFTEGKAKGKTLRDYTVLTTEALWKVRQILEALGVNVPKKKVDLRPLLKKVIGKELVGTVVDDEYENKISSKLSDYMDLDSFDPDAEEEEDEDDDEDEDDEDEVDLDELDRDELKAHIKEHKLDVKVKKSMDEDDIREAIKAASSDDDEDDDEVEDLDLEGL